MKKNEGWAIHLHHDKLVEWCYDYDERVEVIKTQKLKNEVETRLKLFKLLPKEAIAEIPLYYREADQKYQEADQKREEAYQKREEAYQKYQEAYQKYQEADQKREEAEQKWSQKEKEIFHKKWCGCKEWKNGEINFREAKE